MRAQTGNSCSYPLGGEGCKVGNNTEKNIYLTDTCTQRSLPENYWMLSLHSGGITVWLTSLSKPDELLWGLISKLQDVLVHPDKRLACYLLQTSHTDPCELRRTVRSDEICMQLCLITASPGFFFFFKCRFHKQLVGFSLIWWWTLGQQIVISFISFYLVNWWMLF